MKNLPGAGYRFDAVLYRSTPLHHTPEFYVKRELVGARPLHLACARPFGRLKAPLGLSLLRCAAQTRTCRGEAPPSCLRKTVLSLKSPTGAFIAPLRCANANLSGRGPSILLRKTVRSLKSPTGAFIAPLRCANANLSGQGPSILPLPLISEWTSSGPGIPSSYNIRRHIDGCYSNVVLLASDCVILSSSRITTSCRFCCCAQ